MLPSIRKTITITFLAVVTHYTTISNAQTTQTATLYTVLTSGQQASPTSLDPNIDKGGAGSVTFSPIETAKDGSETTYLEEMVFTKVFVPIISGADELTGIPSTITVSATVVESANGFHATLGPIPDNAGALAGQISEENCVFDGDGNATCVFIAGEVSGKVEMLTTRTVQGTEVPFTTLTAVMNGDGSGDMSLRVFGMTLTSGGFASWRVLRSAAGVVTVVAGLGLGTWLPL
ncbi:hypothetical protein D9758_015845 [Tetrapyrgos nigripes]|uniref:Uncharacterized protein n=1 Tax=Tetrapyrgos nigripes TaxID=182062 RepID=A0A8H5C7R2_9AGAR|nr:hypothetical protein D9758_015845 [Tetrapyrgos nigripes]